MNKYYIYFKSGRECVVTMEHDLFLVFKTAINNLSDGKYLNIDDKLIFDIFEVESIVKE